MNSKLLDAIHRHVSKSEPMGFQKFNDLLNSHKEGREKVEQLWDKQHKEDGFPPQKIHMSDYFLNLCDKGIITNYQLDILTTELLRRQDLT